MEIANKGEVKTAAVKIVYNPISDLSDGEKQFIFIDFSSFTSRNGRLIHTAKGLIDEVEVTLLVMKRLNDNKPASMVIGESYDAKISTNQANGWKQGRVLC